MSVIPKSESLMKTVVSVAEMSRLLGLSRARLYQLVRAGTLPWPCYLLDSRRPVFFEEQQRQCLEVRRRNCGIDGKPVLFYPRRSQPSAVRPRPRQTPTPVAPRADLLDSLKALGLSATASEVDAAIAELHPNGTAGMDEGELFRGVFQRLRRQDSGDTVRR